MNKYKNMSVETLRRIYHEKGLLLEKISNDINELKEKKDPALERYLLNFSYLSLYNINVDADFVISDELPGDLVLKIEETKTLIFSSNIVREFLALKRYGKELIHEIKDIEDNLMESEDIEFKVK